LPGCQIGFDRRKDAARYQVSESGVVVVTGRSCGMLKS
jgi:hypothetical protein